MDIQLVWSIFTALRQMRRRERWTRSQLEAYQAKALSDLRHYTYEHSPFYQEFHRGLMDRPLHELPVLTKSMLMEHFDEVVTDRRIHLDDVRVHMAALQNAEPFLGRYWTIATSGSTGQPGIFLYSRPEMAIWIVGGARVQQWAGVKVGLGSRQRTAVIASSSPQHGSTQLGAILRSPWVSTLRLSAADPLDKMVRQLNAWQPETLIIYPSIARLLIEEQHAGHLQIKPTAIFTSAEVLTEETRRRIEALWGTIVFDSYGATESGGLAFECEHHRGLHLTEDVAILEVVDENNQPVPMGVYGEKLLVTVLFKRVQPLIRYELSDSLRLAAETCPSGRPFRLVDSIQGRTEDILYFPASTGGEVAVHPNIFHHIMDTVEASGWRVVQDVQGLTLLFSGLNKLSFSEQTLVNELRQALVQQGAVPPPIRIERIVAIPRGASGKAPLIRSHQSQTSSLPSGFA